MAEMPDKYNLMHPGTGTYSQVQAITQPINGFDGASTTTGKAMASVCSASAMSCWAHW